ncbi:uncharacterized protein LOC118763828 [Octopus sinensis]|uniref:Uncharacterized protein LOC118763828 n=1 Tax=Octopus sinensis TaxID=2607531 RepID=A0A7E6EVC2_9MOLL|nr:uncharacterized protein LOC118763828 [Octopus sinensis]
MNSLNSLAKILIPIIAIPTVFGELDVASECNGCYMTGICICNGSSGILRTMYECMEVECLHNDIKIHKSYCKDNKGNCMEKDEKRIGVYNNRCVTFTCKFLMEIPRIDVHYNLVCMLEHVYAGWQKLNMDHLKQC